MKYITGLHALNLPCKLETTGDWHCSSLDWENVTYEESQNSVFGDYGIEKNSHVFCLDTTKLYNKANHIRAVLDCLAKGLFNGVQGFRNDFFCVEINTEDFFQKVLLLQNNPKWQDIVKAMCREYKMLWVNFLKKEKIMDIYNKDEFHELKQNIDWQEKHKEVILSFLQTLNNSQFKDCFILKGGTALLTCYDLPRFSEDIDLDALFPRKLNKFIEEFCKKNEYTYSIKKETDTTSRFMINYGDERTPLKIEISYRNIKRIKETSFCRVNNILTYTINTLFNQKNRAFIGRDKIRDFFDILFIYKNYKDKLNEFEIENFTNSLLDKNIEHFDYLMKTNEDPFFMNNDLEEIFLTICDELSIFSEA